MARARNIKPGFFTNDLLGEIDPLGRLLFAGLWTLADREGRLQDRPKKVKAEVLPYDNCDADALLGELHDRGFVLRYESDGERYIQIINWQKHQQPHYKEVASLIPPPPGHIDSDVVAFGVPKAQRQRVLDRDKHRCVECGSVDDLSVDHVIARSKGGSGDDDNLQTLCRRCNSGKGNRDVDSTSVQCQSKVESTSPNHDQPCRALTLNPLTDSLSLDSLSLDSLSPLPVASQANGAAQAPPESESLFLLFCELRTIDPAAMPKGVKSRYLADLRQLVATYGETDVGDCMRWLETWREVPWKPKTVGEVIEEWIGINRPKTGRRPPPKPAQSSGPPAVVSRGQSNQYQNGGYLNVRGKPN